MSDTIEGMTNEMENRDHYVLKVRGESNKDGNIVHHLTNQIMIPTDFSPLS